MINLFLKVQHHTDAQKIAEEGRKRLRFSRGKRSIGVSHLS